MPRPRFHRLPVAKQSAILDAARDEFAQHGYADASQNRIIEAAQVSKGAFYYYFDDKDDLFGAVLARQFAGLGEALRFGQPTTAEEFWQEVAHLLERGYAELLKTPESLALARAITRSVGNYSVPPAVHALIGEAERATIDVVQLGQHLGAIRTDLPRDLLVALVMKLGEAVDLWLAEHATELSPDQLARLQGDVVGLLERVLAP